jgi:LAO/AO transport system ATPase
MSPAENTEALAAAIRRGDRTVLPQAITLIESTRADHRAQAQQLLLELMPDAGRAMHVGITGVPGVGKSTAIEALGMYLIESGHRVAVLAVDPSSTRTGGSILGDKTRMSRLAVQENAYIRPSPTSGTLGGVTRATRETIVLLESAGFDVILVETVGVGQSEVALSNMVDTFVFLTLARTGDQLQGIKTGVLELADIVVVNKADGKYALEATAAARATSAAQAAARRAVSACVASAGCSGQRCRWGSASLRKGVTKVSSREERGLRPRSGCCGCCVAAAIWRGGKVQAAAEAQRRGGREGGRYRRCAARQRKEGLGVGTYGGVGPPKLQERRLRVPF